ncbi:GIY-YIG nuclease family protein [Mesorhizobium sp. B1-1-6]|uniref:GIY-YIG nuclease family protein n=1 Tax=Mesorhizobium sp. B1-1-6 TaxID=2589978 RepID=UPI00112D880C|nr:GIY-YIG nuclease family protein [Mesorhizobium sp. B1-1-6]TPN34778.1 GIY-YIG nuclease family protein [Mesorhizobium sp. B1-1-6]
MSPYTPEQVSRIDKLIRANGIGVVYIIAHDLCGPVKIGKSTFLGTRLDGLQTGNPNKLHVFAAFLALGSAHIMEARIHAALRDVRLNGEWFAIPVDEAKRSCRAAIRKPAYTAPKNQIEGQGGTSEPKPKKSTSHAALKAIYKKRIAEWSRNVPSSPADRSRNSLVRK